MKRFVWYGTSVDVVSAVEIVRAHDGMRFLMPDALDGQPVFLDGKSSDIAHGLFRNLYGLIAGPFSVDIEVRSFVLERSGPLLYFSLPLLKRDGLICKASVSGAGSGELHAGYLGVQSSYSVTSNEAHPNPWREVREAWAALVLAMKKRLLLRRGRAWLGPDASRLVDAGLAVLV